MTFPSVAADSATRLLFYETATCAGDVGGGAAEAGGVKTLLKDEGLPLPDVCNPDSAPKATLEP
jgi:hypothetical protein